MSEDDSNLGTCLASIVCATDSLPAKTRTDELLEPSEEQLWTEHYF